MLLLRRVCCWLSAPLSIKRSSLTKYLSVVNDLNQCADNQYTHSEPFRTVVLGNFDGLHIGHQQLIQLGKSIADAN
ncbi:MAG: hypothetical protein IIV42_05555, partial [Peptococcaceae bacterium]|nr:hypothetical protein [Peptococcaceae bacterium]